MQYSHVIYHGNCYDGFGSAFATWLHLGDKPQYIPAFYGMPVPDLPKSARVLICDFSWPREKLLKMAVATEELIVLDHHKTAAEALSGLPFAKFDMAHSGSVMTWDHFNPEIGDQIPSFFLYLQDRDLWQFKLDKSREVSTALRSYPMDFKVWLNLYRDMDLLKTEGVICQRLTDQMVKVMADNAIFLDIDGHTVPVANATVFFSEVGEELCKRFPKHEFAAYYMDRKDGKRQWGLRSRNGFDVSLVARNLGGGGHPAAAGFTEELRKK